MANFKRGDRLILKSDGSRITVDHVGHKKYAFTEYSKDGVPTERLWDHDSLESRAMLQLPSILVEFWFNVYVDGTHDDTVYNSKDAAIKGASKRKILAATERFSKLVNIPLQSKHPEQISLSTHV